MLLYSRLFVSPSHHYYHRRRYWRFNVYVSKFVWVCWSYIEEYFSLRSDTLHVTYLRLFPSKVIFCPLARRFLTECRKWMTLLVMRVQHDVKTRRRRYTFAHMYMRVRMHTHTRSRTLARTRARASTGIYTPDFLFSSGEIKIYTPLGERQILFNVHYI